MVDTKSKWTSKTFLTSLALSVFGVLIALGILPASFDSAGFVGVIVAAGGAATAVFRLMANTKLI